MPTIAIILPAFNEEQTIVTSVESFHRDCPEATIWVINNCSTDSTEIKAKDIFDRLKIQGGVINERRKGKGNAVRCAFTNIEADVYVISDADSTYPSYDIRKLLQPVLNGEADMVVGDRHIGGNYANENKRALHGFGNILVRKLVNYLFRANLSDILSGYRVFSRRFVKTYPVLVEGFELETDLTLHALDKRLSIVELPIDYRDRPEGSVSKLNTYSDGFRVLRTLSNILRHYRPLVFFGTLSLAFFLMGLGVGATVIEEYIRTSYITHVPLAILSTGIEIIAVVLAAIGIILDSIVYHDKRMFERDLIKQSIASNLTNENKTDDETT
jgi:glycosyltransferase involved in cell wall biosynthesis